MSQAAAPMDDATVVFEIPDSLIKLIRMVMRGFYELEEYLIMEALMKYPCVKEDDLADLLKLEKKQLRMLTNNLKNHKFLKSKLTVEVTEDKKILRQNYYYINYSGFVNVVKYKLDHIRKKIESEERNQHRKASFQCPRCQKTYGELEADMLYDIASATFRCSFCDAELTEDISTSAHSNETQNDGKTILAKFNQQIEPIFDLLREVDGIKLHQSLQEPEPMLSLDKILKDKMALGNKGDRKMMDQDKWSGDATKNMLYNYAESRITVQIGDGSSVKEEQQQQKERPVWLTHSTVDGSSADQDLTTQGNGHFSVDDNDASITSFEDSDIMKTLLIHEQKSKNKFSVSGVPKEDSDDNASTTSSSSDESSNPNLGRSSPLPSTRKVEVKEVEKADEFVEQDLPMVTVGGKEVSLDAVTDELVAIMTPEEKEAYIKIAQETYSHFYE